LKNGEEKQIRISLKKELKNIYKNVRKNMVDYKPLTEEEIKKLADDIYRGFVFTDRHVRNPDDILRVFMPLVLFKEEQIEEFKANIPGMIYEYMDKAGPMSIDGMPMFCSFRFLSKEDAKKVDEKYLQIKKAIENV
jgi:hypothetical protein